MPATAAEPDAGSRLIDGALSLIRATGYPAATVDELRAASGVTRGALFHHFKSKDELGVAAEIAADSIDRLRRHIELPFAAPAGAKRGAN